MPTTLTDGWDCAYAASAGISRRHSPHHDAQKFTIIGPRSPAMSTERPPPRHGRVTPGKPLSAPDDVTAGQSGMRLSFLNATSCLPATSIAGPDRMAPGVALPEQAARS